MKHKECRIIAKKILLTPHLIACVFLHQPELVAIDQTGKAEINGGLNPENANLWQNLAEGGTHGVHTDEGPYTEGAGEEPRHALPIAGDA